MLVFNDQHGNTAMSSGLESFSRALSPATCSRCEGLCAAYSSCPRVVPDSCLLTCQGILFRATISQELMNSGRGLAQFSKFCLCCKNLFHGGSNVKWLPLPLHTWWHLWTLMYIDSWTNSFLLASSLLLVITEHTANGRHQHLIWQSQLESCIWCLRKPLVDFSNKLPFCSRQAFIYKADLGWMLYLLQLITLETCHHVMLPCTEFLTIYLENLLEQHVQSKKEGKLGPLLGTRGTYIAYATLRSGTFANNFTVG